MPGIVFKGKEYVYNHHLTVPYRPLVPQADKSIGPADLDSNLVVHGTNPVDAEDMLRHDKWLCMMWPRLVLLRELLSERGSLWMTLDDNEVHRARMVIDEIFGEQAFIASVIWQKNFPPKNTAQFFSEDHDYLLVVAKDKDLWRPRLLERSAEMEARYSNPDEDNRGPWT